MGDAPRKTAEDWRRERAEEAREISDMLTDRIEELAPILLPEGVKAGREWRAGSKGSKSIILASGGRHRRGTYTDWEQGGKGQSPLFAVAELICNGSMRDAVAWSRSFLGIEKMHGDELELARKRSEERRAAEEKRAAEAAHKRARTARGIWHNAAPLEGSPAAAYLEGSRGIELARLGTFPGALRYRPDVYCKARQGHYPAMVSSLWRLGEPKMIAVHRTFLDVHEDGRVTKAAGVDPVRSILGSWPGAVIPLTRGEAGTRWKDIEEGELVCLGEGIEEGLSVAMVKPAWRCAAVGFVGNFGQVLLPVWCHVVLAINNDAEGSPAHVAIFGGETPGGRRVPGAIAELEDKGHVVKVARPPSEFADWNDFLRGIRRE